METNSTLKIRTARAEDAPALLNIYAPYVEESAVTFEYTVPTPEEFCRRITTTLSDYPYLVLAEGDSLLGYAYAGPLKNRAAYAWAAETSIYLRQDLRRQGYGRLLYEALERTSRAQHLLNLNACIASPIGEDPYLTDASIRFHARLGYQKVAHFHRCGYKFDRWYDMIWMEKPIGEHTIPPRPVIPFSELSKDPVLLHSLGIQSI